MTIPATSSGALKALIESGGLRLAAYRDAIPRGGNMPCVTIDEEVATSQEAHGDSGDPNAHRGESEQLFVHLWELWRTAEGNPAETYGLPRRLKALILAAPGLIYGPTDAPVRVYGLQIAGHARIVEEEANVVHHTITVTMRRDA